MQVKVSAKKTQTKSANPDGPAENGSYAFDATYHGRGANSNYLRFAGAGTGHNLLVEDALPTGGYALRAGGKGGYLQYTYTGDVYENVLYICKR
jgi:hypothetical protein